MQESSECIIVGGGPAGLMAAVYLGRFRRNVVVIDAGQSRAALIPRSHNLPGFAHGLSGPELLARMRQQVEDLRVPIVNDEVLALARDAEGFRLTCRYGKARAPIVVLAAGLVDAQPPFAQWEQAVADGILRYCPICDAFEASGKRIAVVGPLRHAAGKALFLRNYSRDVTLLATDRPPEGDDRLTKAGVNLLYAPQPTLCRDGDRMKVRAGDHDLEFDVLYPAMGAKVRSELALGLGADHNEGGFLKVDDRQHTSVENLFGIGDVVTDLHQISVAFGHAAVAACAAHNRLPRKLA